MKFPRIEIRNAFIKQRLIVLRETVWGIFVALLVSVYLTFVAHFWICVGLHPETIFIADWIAPLLGTFCGAWSIAQHFSESRGWKVGFRVAPSLIALWFVACGYLAARFDFAKLAVTIFRRTRFRAFLRVEFGAIVWRRWRNSWRKNATFQTTKTRCDSVRLRSYSHVDATGALVF